MFLVPWLVQRRELETFSYLLHKTLELKGYREKSRDRSIYIDKPCISKSAGRQVLLYGWQTTDLCDKSPKWGVVRAAACGSEHRTKAENSIYKDLFSGVKHIGRRFGTGLDRSFESGSMEWFIEDQAFSRSCELAHHPPLPLPSVSSTDDTQ